MNLAQAVWHGCPFALLVSASFEMALHVYWSGRFDELSWRDRRRPMLPQSLVDQPGKARELFEQVG